MDYEVEMKFRLQDAARLQRELELLGAKEEKSSRQTDVYLRHPSRNFAVTDEALRVREDDGQLFLTYKGPKVDSTTKTRQEIEIGIGDGSRDLERVTDLFACLGFTVVATVAKTRVTSFLVFEGQEMYVAIDTLDSLGAFVELEAMSDESAFAETRDKVLRLAQRLDLRDSERRSYLEMLLQRREG